jgi:hypothetical protein
MSVAKCETGWGDGLSPAAVFHWFDFRIPRTVQLHINPFEDSRQVTGDLGIPEADDTISLLLKLPGGLMSRPFVRLTPPRPLRGRPSPSRGG